MTSKISVSATLGIITLLLFSCSVNKVDNRRPGSDANEQPTDSANDGEAGSEKSSDATKIAPGDDESNSSEQKSNDARAPLIPPVGPETTTANLTGFQSKHFTSSMQCERCHNGITDENSNDVSIPRAWGGSMMANSSRDPFWRAKVSTELKRNPNLKHIIADKCTRCHTPMASVEAHKMTLQVKPFEDGILNPDNPMYGIAIEGVGCTLCHQIMNTAKLGTAAGFSGKYEVESFDNATDRKIYGPFDGINAQPMINNVQYRPEASSHIKDSKLCGSCHNLKTPFVDRNGKIISTPETEFPEQMVYSEWEASRYKEEQSCQDCHMTRTNAPIASRPRGLASREGFAQHIFVGGNKMMLDVFKRYPTELKVASNNFDYSIQETEKMLQGAARLSLVGNTVQGLSTTITIKVENFSGHKLPSGFPSRRVILHFQIFDAAGNLVMESGKPNPDGSIEGLDQDKDKTKFESHHDVITSSSQVQVYEAVMKNSDREVTYTLLRGAGYLKDNRLLPDGFDKATVSSDIQAIGDAMTDANFTGGSDLVSYKVPAVVGAGYTLKAELLFQPLGKAFADDMFSDQTEETNIFKPMFDSSEFKSTLINSLNVDF